MSILRSRRYLPHLEHPNSIYFVTFRQAGSVPPNVLNDWKHERSEIINRAAIQKRDLSAYEKNLVQNLLTRRIQKYLDQSYGDCWLKNPEIAQLVVDSLKHHDGTNYRLDAWCVMPNHVHVVFKSISTGRRLQSDLIPIVQYWKSYTAHQANKILKRNSSFWQSEYYDHLIRSDEEFARCCEYTLHNPVQAGLCKNWRDWTWSGCRNKIRELLDHWRAGSPAPQSK